MCSRDVRENHEAQNDKLCDWSGRGKCLSLIGTVLKDKQAACVNKAMEGSAPIVLKPEVIHVTLFM
jgi:hypothetical protein